MTSEAASARPTDPNALVLEAWGQGFMVGALVVMAAMTIANMRKGVLLHKLILTELILGMFHGTWIFTTAPVYGWYLSATAIGLMVSWSLHNVIAWMKNRPFLSRRLSAFYITTVILVQPYWVVEIYAVFAYYNNINDIFKKTRPLEPLFRDPWWLFTTCSLCYIIKREYNFGLVELIRISPRFGVMLTSMCLSLIFVLFDILSVTGVLNIGLPTGVEPFWKFSFIFKCLCDIVILDDFKTALDRIRSYWLSRIDSSTGTRRGIGEFRGSIQGPKDLESGGGGGSGGSGGGIELMPSSRKKSSNATTLQGDGQSPSQFYPVNSRDNKGGPISSGGRRKSSAKTQYSVDDIVL